MSDLVYFLKKGFENTKDITSFMYFLSKIKERITSYESENIAISIFSNITIENIQDDIPIFFEKIRMILKEDILAKEKIVKIILNDFLKKYMNFFETEDNKHKADSFLYLYFNLLSEEQILSIFHSHEIIYKMIEADFSSCLNFFDKKGLDIFENENNINAINDEKWLTYIQNKDRDIISAKSNNKKYEKAWENLYFKNERVSLKRFLTNTISDEDIKKVKIKKYFTDLDDLLVKPHTESVPEDFIFSQEDALAYKDKKGRNALFLSIYNNKIILKKLYRKKEVKEEVKVCLKEKDNEGRNVLPYCFFHNDLSNIVKVLVNDISPSLDNKGKGIIEQFLDLKRGVRTNISFIYESILEKCSDDILMGDQDSLVTKLVQIMNSDRKELSKFLPFFRAVKNINNFDSRLKTIWIVAQVEEKYSLSLEEELEKLLRKGITIDEDSFKIDIFDLLEEKVWPQYFKDKVIVFHNENILKKKNGIEEGNFKNNIILNRI